MTEDARFEDGREAPLNLGALDAEDLTVIASLTQDAVFPASEMRWHRTGARFALLLNRLRTWLAFLALPDQAADHEEGDEATNSAKDSDAGPGVDGPCTPSSSRTSGVRSTIPIVVGIGIVAIR